MSYVRCYRCGVGCLEGSFVRMDVGTHGGIRRANVCRACARVYRTQAKKATQQLALRARLGLILTAVGTVVFLVALAGYLWWQLSK